MMSWKVEGLCLPSWVSACFLSAAEPSSFFQAKWTEQSMIKRITRQKMQLMKSGSAKSGFARPNLHESRKKFIQICSKLTHSSNVSIDMPRDVAHSIDERPCASFTSTSCGQCLRRNLMESISLDAIATCSADTPDDPRRSRET